MKVSIYTMRRTVYEGETTRVTLPTMVGQVTILNNHEPYTTILLPGELKYTKSFTEGPNQGESEERLVIKGGFLEVREGNQIRVLADE